MDAKKYDYIVVGAGIFGAVIAERLASKNKNVLVVDRRDHIAGNIYSKIDKATGIEVHKYGSHIFHTKDDDVWNYLSKFADFNNYVHTVNARHNNKLYPMPINLETINKFYNLNMTAAEAEQFIKSEVSKENIANPSNFEEKGISLVGRKLYEAFLRNYTRKQWGTDPCSLSSELLHRIPLRFSNNNRYFMDAKYQGIPKDGYTKMVENILHHPNITVKLNVDFNSIKNDFKNSHIVYCGQVDELLGYQLGILPYRSLRFEEERTTNGLGAAVVNESDLDVQYTRTHDYKYYQIHEPKIIEQPISIICREYPANFQKGSEAYYPINNPESEKLYLAYVKLAKQQFPNLVLGGRLGAYRYWDMDVAVKNALDLAERIG